jgi:hypothetical protein
METESNKMKIKMTKNGVIIRDKDGKKEIGKMRIMGDKRYINKK